MERIYTLYSGSPVDLGQLIHMAKSVDGFVVKNKDSDGNLTDINSLDDLVIINDDFHVLFKNVDREAPSDQREADGSTSPLTDWVYQDIMVGLTCQGIMHGNVTVELSNDLEVICMKKTGRSDASYLMALIEKHTATAWCNQLEHAPSSREAQPLGAFLNGIPDFEPVMMRIRDLFSGNENRLNEILNRDSFRVGRNHNYEGSNFDDAFTQWESALQFNQPKSTIQYCENGIVREFAKLALL